MRPSSGRTKVVVGGIPIDALSQIEWAQLMVRDCTKGDHRAFPKFMTSANGFVVSLYAHDPAFKRLLDEADGIDADGMSLVVASRMFARPPLPERVATTDFFHVAARFAEHAGLSFFLLGSTEEKNRAATESVHAAYPELRIVGRHHGYFTRTEEKAVVQKIAAAEPDVLWVGMGVPREHQFVVRNRTQLGSVNWIKTCGGLFKFLAGERRAPHCIQKLCLEWAFRMAREPRRLFSRYYRTNAHAAYLIYKYRALTRDSSFGMRTDQVQLPDRLRQKRERRA